MAAYGRGQTLGSGINPESFKQDYSGFAQAAQMQAQGIANLGAQIGQATGDYFKQQNEKKKAVKQASTQIDAALKLFPDLAPTFGEAQNRLRDDDIPLSERAAEAETIAGLINMGVTSLRNQATIDLERDKMEIEKDYRQSQIDAAKNAASSKSMTFAEIAMGEGKQQAILDKSTGIARPIVMQGFNQPASGLSNLPDPLKPFAKDFESAGAKYGVPSALLAAIAMHETGGGTSSAFRNKNNAMGVSDASGPVQMGSVSESIEKMAGLLGKGINEGTGPYANAKTIDDIARVYAPIGAGNDPNGLNQNWTQGVSANIQKLIQPTQSQSNQDRVGFIPNEPEKPIETWKPATPEQSAMYGGVPGQMSSTGRFYPINLPSGMTIETDSKGGIKVVQGSGVGSGAKAASAEKAEDYKADKAMALTQDLNWLEGRSQKMIPGVAGAAGRMVAEMIPATEQAENKKVIDRVISSLTLENLQTMRNSNPTGASLGNISDKDTGLLRDSATALSNSQDPASFRKELVRLKNLQHDLVYGSERVLKRKLEQGEITQSDFDEAMRSAPASFIDEKGNIQRRSFTPSAASNPFELSPSAKAAKDKLEAEFK